MDELLETISAQELHQWAAYERAFGPVGTWYADELLADIHEQLQALGAQNQSDINHYPRRTELHAYFERMRELEERQETPQDTAAAEFEAEMAARERAKTA